MCIIARVTGGRRAEARGGRCARAAGQLAARNGAGREADLSRASTEPIRFAFR